RLNAGLARWDRSAALWGADHASAASTSLLRVVSLLGSFGGGVVVISIAAAISFARHRRRSMIMFMLTVTIGQTIITNTTKYLVGRARPDIDRLTGFSGSSFPSGHSATAAALYASVALVLGRGASWPVRTALASAAVAIATAVAASRVLLGVHWLTDVIGGLAMGWGWFAVVSIAFGGRWLHFGAPIETARRIEENARVARVAAVDGGTNQRPPDASAVDRRGGRPHSGPAADGSP
ncbi:MAG: phosphatase PAP2 family protein, partial [Acidimicrobiia bacterium]